MIERDIIDDLYGRRRFGIKPGLDMISALAEELGSPHEDLKVVHVAGTNGKGSVCAMIQSVLSALELDTGLYTSPHLVDINERIKINNSRISDEELGQLITDVGKADKRASVRTGRQATYFEFMTALAFEYFRRKNVRIAIVETGMGGAYDATNIVASDGFCYYQDQRGSYGFPWQ